MTSPMIELRAVHKAFGSTRVLNGIDLHVDRHEVVCLIGPSGSGKSTILRCINGLEPVGSGRVVVGGVDDWCCPRVRSDPEMARRLTHYSAF